MIAELTDRQILEFLMTSDFNENLSPDETRFLLLKFRNFYRVVASKNETLVGEIEILKKNQTMIEDLNKKVLDLTDKNSNLSDRLNTIMNKKLSIKERIFGKIIE